MLVQLSYPLYHNKTVLKKGKDVVGNYSLVMYYRVERRRKEQNDTSLKEAVRPSLNTFKNAL